MRGRRWRAFIVQALKMLRAANVSAVLDLRVAAVAAHIGVVG
jgi:hypothetical protein